MNVLDMVIQCHEAKKVSLNFGISVLGGAIHVYGTAFVKNEKRTEEYCLNSLNWTKVENRENGEMSVSSVNSGHIYLKN